MRGSALFCQEGCELGTITGKGGQKNTLYGECVCVFMCIIVYLHNNAHAVQFVLAATVFLNCQAPSESSVITDPLMLFETCLSHIF